MTLLISNTGSNFHQGHHVAVQDHMISVTVWEHTWYSTGMYYIIVYVSAGRGVKHQRATQGKCIVVVHTKSNNTQPPTQTE